MFDYYGVKFTGNHFIIKEDVLFPEISRQRVEYTKEAVLLKVKERKIHIATVNPFLIRSPTTKQFICNMCPTSSNDKLKAEDVREPQLVAIRQIGTGDLLFPTKLCKGDYKIKIKKGSC